jgi:glycosyltransferase involved in cell wall biosynthesis
MDTVLYLVEVAFVRSNSLLFDGRVLKTLRTLSKRYGVLALGWDRKGIYDATKMHKELKWNPYSASNVAVKVLNLRAPFNQESIGSYLPMIIYFPVFWTWVFLRLSKARPKIVHACDLDTVLPCFLYKLLFRRKLILDVYDRYAMTLFDRYAITLIPGKFKVLGSILNIFEEYFSKRSDVLINISEDLLLTFRNKPKNCIIIRNCPEDVNNNKIESKYNAIFTIVYTGAIWRKTRGLEYIIEAIKDVTDIQLVLAGWYRQKDKAFLDEIVQIPNVKYRGVLQPKDALRLESSSDVMIALYEPKLRLYSIAMPNKLFDAMMCGVPLITNLSSKLINEVGFAMIVKYDDVQAIKKAILTLRDDAELRKKLGLNGRKAYLEKYSWSKMEEELFRVYESLQLGMENGNAAI